MQIIYRAPLAALGLGAAFTVVWGVADPVAALAEVRVIEADGYYIMGDGPEENAAVAKERARADARRAASEQAGLYVAGMTEVKKGKLTRDEIRTISAAVLEVKEDDVTPEVLGGTVIQYHCHMKAVVDTGSITDQLRQDRARLAESVQRNKELEAENARINAELVKIKAEYQQASEDEKQRLNVEMQQNEQRFQAVEWYERGEAYMQKANAGDYRQAAECYQKSIDIDPGYAPAWASMGFVYQYREDFNRAIEYCRKAIELDPGLPRAWSTLSIIYRKQKDYDKAMKYCRKAVELDPKQSAPWNNLGNIYDEMGDWDKAQECWRKAIELNPESAQPWYNIGRLYIDRGEYQKGLEYCRKAVELAPRFDYAWNSIGVAYANMGEIQKAIEAFKKALEIAPDSETAKGNLKTVLGWL